MEGLLKDRILLSLQEWIRVEEQVIPKTDYTHQSRHHHFDSAKPLVFSDVIGRRKISTNELKFHFYGNDDDFYIFERLMRRFTGPPSNFRTPDRFFLMDRCGKFIACASHENVSKVLWPECWLGRTTKDVFSPLLVKQFKVCLDSTICNKTEQDLIFMIKHKTHKFRVFERFIAISDSQVAVFAWDTNMVQDANQ